LTEGKDKKESLCGRILDKYFLYNRKNFEAILSGDYIKLLLFHDQRPYSEKISSNLSCENLSYCCVWFSTIT